MPTINRGISTTATTRTDVAPGDAAVVDEDGTSSALDRMAPKPHAVALHRAARDGREKAAGEPQRIHAIVALGKHAAPFILGLRLRLAAHA